MMMMATVNPAAYLTKVPSVQQLVLENGNPLLGYPFTQTLVQPFAHTYYGRRYGVPVSGLNGKQYCELHMQLEI